MIDTRLYNNPLLLAKILTLLDTKLSDEEKKALKEQFKKN